ncbi:MAG: homoserine kinase [Candidatus Dormibacteraeota bacterium]|nr:homoserine kinase [Candidatus Dormibacteraeota bacterium]
MRVTVRVPASVANLGPGFDCMALALQLQNDVIAEERGDDFTLSIEGIEDGSLHDVRTNLVARAFVAASESIGAKPTGLQLHCVNRIPMGVGLGSSAAATLAGVLVAVAVHHAPWDSGAVLDCAASLEGHADNAAAALLGGLAIAAPEAEALSVNVSDELRAVLWLPGHAVATRDSRQVVPPAIPRADAVFNAARCALLLRALTLPDLQSLSSAMQDRWHQAPRFALMPSSAAVLRAALDAGAAGASLAGAGPAVIALTTSAEEQIAAAMQTAGDATGEASRTMVLRPRNFGTRVDVRP